MDKDSTTFGLKPDKLAQLWNMGGKMDRGKNEESNDQTKAELLRDRLAQKIPLDHVVAQILPKALAQICKDIQPFTGNSYGILLNDPLTDVTIIKKIKDNTKKLSQYINSDTEYDVITVIYYAAIASALIYHDQRITSFSYSHLNDKYISLLENTWLTSDLRNMFQKALNCCGQKMKSGKNVTP
ncbi:MAG: hypothetical protein GY845_36605 [Planctomycetes bacterium]|nr:hypothetical protein [Planctomycetota bacterium]